MDRPAQVVRQVHRLLDGAVDIGDHGDRDEHEPDGEQALVEIARPVKPVEHRALEHDADRGRCDEGDGQGGQERPSHAVHQRDRDIAADHAEGAVREIDEVHHPERHRQPDRQQEQQHAVGKAVEQDAECRCNHCGRPSRPLDRHDAVAATSWRCADSTGP